MSRNSLRSNYTAFERDVPKHSVLLCFIGRTGTLAVALLQGRPAQDPIDPAGRVEQGGWEWPMRSKLTTIILIGMVLGILVGYACHIL
jgi:hypothetical protein